jgi:hypothetical protein
MFSGMNITNPSDSTVLQPGVQYWFTFYSPTTFSPNNAQVLDILNSALGGIAVVNYAAAPQSSNNIYIGLIPSSAAPDTPVSGWVTALLSIFQNVGFWQGLMMSDISDAQFVSVTDTAPTPYFSPSGAVSDMTQSISDAISSAFSNLNPFSGVSDFFSNNWPYLLGGGLLLIILLKKK